MSAKRMAAVSVSRPKIHRLPIASPPPASKFSAASKEFFENKPLVVCVVLFILYFPLANMLHQSAKDTPPAKVTKNAAAVSKAPSSASGEEPGMLQAPISDAHASTVFPESASKTIVLQGDNQKIVGQMAKIPSRPEQITEIKNISDVDNDAGRELLSIISKY